MGRGEVEITHDDGESGSGGSDVVVQLFVKFATFFPDFLVGVAVDDEEVHITVGTLEGKPGRAAVAYVFEGVFVGRVELSEELIVDAYAYPSLPSSAVVGPDKCRVVWGAGCCGVASGVVGFG